MFRNFRYLILCVGLAFAAKPMEPLTNYNVIMVHGAADSGEGIKDGLCSDKEVESAPYVHYGTVYDAATMMGHYKDNDPENEGEYNLIYFLDSAIFENVSIDGNGKRKYLSVRKTNASIPAHFSSIYAQRPFFNPANSPFENGKEIGDRTFDGSMYNGNIGKCPQRRSLIEEAQEVRAKGRTNLSNLRKDVTKRDQLPPSRNILIAHSMGGVASREYVQGGKGLYNEDVDKVITLDSPHEGTEALSLLMYMDEYPADDIYGMLGEFVLYSLLLLTHSDNIESDMLAMTLWTMSLNGAQSLGSNLVNGLMLRDKFPYDKEDPLVPYIDPDNYLFGEKGESPTIEDLRTKKYDPNIQTPMFRLLYSTKALSFTNPNHSGSLPISFIISEAISIPISNFYSQITNDGSMDLRVGSAFASMYFGAFVGFGLEDNGSSLVPDWSGSARNTELFKDANVDVKKVPYSANFTSRNSTALSSVLINGSVALGVASAALSWAPELKLAAKVGIALSTIAISTPLVAASVIPFMDDFEPSHKAPATSKYQQTWKGTKNTYSKIPEGQETIEPYLMEEFLYEKPFVNIRVNSSFNENWEDENNDVLGFYGAKDADGNRDALVTTNKLAEAKPLTFKSSRDWETVAVKKERWETTTGVGGEKIPIRHADRYAAPGFAVKDFIKRYEFEVDDLMPHRLRQIRINFNFNEDIAWECDVNKAEDATDVCKIYKRTPAGPQWDFVQDAKHPVEKDGTFIFEPEEYYKLLSEIQKDNQNTVTITTVNKIGLTNSQRFYYLFKATADLVTPIWPLRNEKISKIEDFTAYANFLDYQGYRVISGEDCIDKICKEMSPPYTYEVGYAQDSEADYSKLENGKYDWRAKIKIGSDNDTTESEMVVPFVFDSIPPKTKLILEQEVINLKNAAFLSRLTTDEELRMVAIFLKQNNSTIATAKYKDIIANDFSIKLSDFGLEELADGKYEIASYAFDGSIGSLNQYNLLNNVVEGDNSKLYELIPDGKVADGINYDKQTAYFYTDTKAPELSITANSTKNSNTLVLNQDSLLKVKLDITDINGKSSAIVGYNILFQEDGKDEFQIGDKIELTDGEGTGEWAETQNMLITDGSYKMIIKVWDEAGNVYEEEYEKTLRIDRTPPKMIEVISTKLLYQEGDHDYSATLYVEQSDKEENLSKMQCSYSINNGNPQQIDEELGNKAERQTLKFSLDKDIVGTNNGKRRLEVRCKDWAGNVSSMLDLFNVGLPYPSISYPVQNGEIRETSIIAISGIAQKRSPNDYLASYKLQWRNTNIEGSDWQTAGIDVGVGKRANESTYWESNSVQSSIGDLGFFDMKDLPDGNYDLMLSVRDCPECEWRDDMVSFYYLSPTNIEGTSNALNFSVGGETFTPNSDFLPISLGIEGADKYDFRVRIYAQDSKGNALFEVSADTLTASPYEGEPNSFEGKGTWFWSENETYNLSWKSLPQGETIAVHYAAGDIDESICQTGCKLKDSLLTSLTPDIYAATGLKKEMRIPQGLNKVMLFSGSSGNVKFKNKKAFWFKPKNNTDTTYKVHFGEKANDLETTVLYSSIGVQVNPDLYGIYYDWNGMASNGSYPQGETVSFYAEAIENINGGKVLRAFAQAQIKKPDLKILSSQEPLDDFYVITYKNDTTNIGNITASYGISGRDANVSAYIIKKSDGTIIKTFFEDKNHTTSNSQNAYSLTWDGTDNNGFLLLDGEYYFEVNAKESGVSDAPQTESLQRDFKISYSPNVEYVKNDEDTQTSLSLLYADSIKEDFWHYTPVADYLVNADATGKWLPEDMRNVNIDWEAEGTQSIYGFPPQRFSLAVKRKREELPLVIVYKLEAYEYEANNSCEWKTPKERFKYGVIKETFSTNNTSKSITIEHNNSSGYGFAEIKAVYLKVWAVQLNYYEAEAGKYIDDKSLVEAVENKAFNTLWNHNILIPVRDVSNASILYTPSADTKCSASLENPCEINEYNYNANLFHLTASPTGDDGKFLTNWNGLYAYCDNHAPRKVGIKLNMKIPPEYWNADYGYDNLVNRTIRIDQTNTTMYGINGYLKAINYPGTFLDGSNNSRPPVNYNYGMLTPFETQVIPFVSVNDLPSGSNAFTFPDEALGYHYSSYYAAYFYNPTKENMRFKAVIAGTPANNGELGSSTIYTGETLLESKLLKHGTVDIQISLEAKPSVFQNDTVEISYPYTGKPKDTCPSYTHSGWVDSTKYSANCYKFYDSGSKIHHKINDFTESDWNASMLASGYLSNNYNPFKALGSAEDKIDCDKSFELDPEKYLNETFHLPTGCRFTSTGGIAATYKPKGISSESNESIYFSNDTIYFKAENWEGSESWRRMDTLSHKGLRDYPTYEVPQQMPITDFFVEDPWIRDKKLVKAQITNLNDSLHTHFSAEIENDNNIKLSAKNPPDVKRPSEFIAIKGSVQSPSNWKLLYLNNKNLNSLATGKTSSISEWLDVNRLQGNTSILLQWGGENNMLSIRKLDLEVGGKITADTGGVVQSIFGEVSVVFPKNALKVKDTVVTVRTADAKDYAFKTLNESTLLGPVIEILPSWEFKDTLPRIKSRIARKEIEDMKISPDRVRLYKVDLENKKFIELQNTLIGFDKEEECAPSEDYKKCFTYSDDWAYLIISAETKTFSTFAALDKNVIDNLIEEPGITDPVPAQIDCSILQDTLWLGTDNGYLKMQQECNQSAMGILQLRKDGNVIAQHNQTLPEAIIWNGIIGLNKIPNGEYSSRYSAISPLGSEMQIMGPVILTDSLRPQVSDFGVNEYSELLDRAFSVNAKIKDNESGVENILLKWDFGGARDSVYLSVDSAGNISHKIVMTKNVLSKCLGCKVIISLSVEDFGHNKTEKEWTSAELYPYPPSLTLWYPALESSGKTVYEKTGTKHDLLLDMKTPWLSASGLYFDESGADKAIGTGSVNLGVLEEYTLEAWVRPGYQYGNDWRRIFGFNAEDGRHVEVFINGKSARLSDGNRSWIALDIFPQNKVWTHFSATVSAFGVNFYSDGKQVFSVSEGTQERAWSGNFSVGAGNSTQAFTGHVMQARLYKRALLEDEIYALYRNIGGDYDYNVEIILANNLQNVSGAYLGFNCAAPGANYWMVENSEAVIKGNFWADKAGTYKAIIYARAAQSGDYAVKVAAMQGSVSAQSVWRPLLLDNINLVLHNGFNEINFTIPSGLEVAGIAISDEPELAVHAITWNMESNPAPSGTVKVQHIFEGADAGMIRPRLNLTNTGNTTINGLKVRYYFRGEDPSQIILDKFYPQDGDIYVRREGNNLGYAEWSFPNIKIAPGESPFWGQGPHFGLHNTDYTPWIAKDDPSYLAEGVVVLDAYNRMLAGSCIEDESPLRSAPEVKVVHNDARNDNSASHLYITLENIGSVPIKNYELMYYFNAFDAQPIFDVYDMQNLSAELKNFGDGKWAVSIVGKNSLGPGIAWKNAAQFALHFANWQNWDKTGFAGIAVFDSLGNRIYGSEPDWKTQSSLPDAPNEKPNIQELESPIKISRTSEGLIVWLKDASYLKLDLTDVSGAFKWSMFEGNLSKGENFIPADWKNLELERTYLVVRLNGTVYPAKLLTELEDL